eukprot:SAG31_NODE_45667_length_258_cov_0.628931_1_plen_23_part_10
MIIFQGYSVFRIPLRDTVVFREI